MDAAMTLRRPALRDRESRAPFPNVRNGSDNGRLSDEDLIALVGARDRDAFGELYRRYTRPVLGLALRRLGDRGRAEDALQEAFTAVWRSAGTFDPGRGAGGAWLYAVARNAIVDGLRRRPEPTAEAVEEPAADAGPDERAEASWLAWRVHRAIAELPEHERRVIELAYWGERSQSEIAAELQIPLGTVKTRTRSGLSRLADLLEGELE
jgi:RNA polymerase sigma-70 factor (ECF subfamily)